MKWAASVVVLVGAVAVAALVLQREEGYATPFGMPSQITWHGRDYINPGCVRKPYDRDLPLRRVGSVPGFLTSAKRIYLPHSMPRGLDPTYLYVRAGCLETYDLSGGP